MHRDITILLQLWELVYESYMFHPCHTKDNIEKKKKLHTCSLQFCAKIRCVKVTFSLAKCLNSVVPSASVKLYNQWFPLSLGHFNLPNATEWVIFLALIVNLKYMRCYICADSHNNLSVIMTQLPIILNPKIGQRGPRATGHIMRPAQNPQDLHRSS